MIKYLSWRAGGNIALGICAGEFCGCIGSATWAGGLGGCIRSSTWTGGFGGETQFGTLSGGFCTGSFCACCTASLPLLCLGLRGECCIFLIICNTYSICLEKHLLNMFRKIPSVKLALFWELSILALSHLF